MIAGIQDEDEESDEQADENLQIQQDREESSEEVPVVSTQKSARKTS